jgi:hypothetical protein
MARSINVNQNGVWKEVNQVWVKDAGVWKSPIEVYIKDGGVWKQTYPAESGSTSFLTPGTYTFNVPNGITSISVSVFGAGGGGGAPFFPGGDGWVGGGGSSGGYIFSTVIQVVPSEPLTVKVGLGGNGGVYVFGGQVPGQNGEDSYVQRAGVDLIRATGGGFGGPGLGSNAPAGSPGGIQGAPPCTPARCGYGYNAPRPGGASGAGYGDGGAGGYFGGQAVAGSPGAVLIDW